MYVCILSLHSCNIVVHPVTHTDSTNGGPSAQLPTPGLGAPSAPRLEAAGGQDQG